MPLKNHLISISSFLSLLQINYWTQKCMKFCTLLLWCNMIKSVQNMNFRFFILYTIQFSASNYFYLNKNIVSIQNLFLNKYDSLLFVRFLITFKKWWVLEPTVQKFIGYIPGTHITNAKRANTVEYSCLETSKSIHLKKYCSIWQESKKSSILFKKHDETMKSYYKLRNNHLTWKKLRNRIHQKH